MLDPRLFRQLMGCFTTGVAVVTLRHKDKGAIGITVNSLTSVSLKPPLLLFCIDRDAHVYPLFKKSPRFAINLLSSEQEDVSRHFADSHHYPRPKGLWDKPQAECPIIRHTLGWAVCRKVAIHKAGDHDIFVGEVEKLHKRSGAREPLLYFHGRYRQIKHERS